MADMTRDEALRQVARVRDGLKAANNALLLLHSGRGWSALGYDSFKAMCDGEFGMSKQRAYQKLDHARTVAVMAELLGIDDDTGRSQQVVDSAVPEGLARDIKDHVPEVVAEARRNLADIPAGLPDQRREIEQQRAVRAAALDVRDRIVIPRRPEQGRRYAQDTSSPFARAVATGRAHVEAIHVLIDGKTPLADAERLRLLDLRDQVAHAYDKATTAWANAHRGAADTAEPVEVRPATDPFLPPAVG